MEAAVTLHVAGSTSANTGIAPWLRIGAMAPMSVIGVVTTSSPGSGSIAATAACIAADPDEHATTWGTPSSAANSSSSCLTKQPLVLVRTPCSRTSASRESSSFPRLRPDAAWSDG